MTNDPLSPQAINIEGEDFDYYDLGTGDPVIFLHGALGDKRTFVPHVQMLSEHYRAIAYTQRYFGDRSWHEAGPAFGVETHARDLINFVRMLDAGPVKVVAWSYSGHVALRAAQIRPELFSAIFIYETGFQTFLTDPQEIAAFKSDIEQLFVPVFAAIAEKNFEQASRILVNGSAGDNYYFDSRTEYQKQIELENASTLTKLLTQAPPPHLTGDDLSAIEVPITVACGDKSREAYKLASEGAMKFLSGPHYLVPGVGHMWPDAEPTAFTEFVRNWLERI